jgi:hypothetical protein
MGRSTIQASKQANPKDRAMLTNNTTSPADVTELTVDQLDDIHGGTSGLDIIAVVVALGAAILWNNAVSHGAVVVTPPA